MVVFSLGGRGERGVGKFLGSFSEIIHLDLLASLFAKLLQNEKIFTFRDPRTVSNLHLLVPGIFPEGPMMTHFQPFPQFLWIR